MLFVDIITAFHITYNAYKLYILSIPGLQVMDVFASDDLHSQSRRLLLDEGQKPVTCKSNV